MADMSSRTKRMRARRIDCFARACLTLIVMFICLVLCSLIAYIVIKGISHITPQFLFSRSQAFRAGGGIGIQLFNSFYLLFITLALSVPLSLGAAIYLTQYAGKNFVTDLIKLLIEMLSSLPSIVVGLFGFLLFVIKFGWGFSILSGSLALTIFNLPILVRVMQQALETVSAHQRDAGLALGLSRWETSLFILIPEALPGIITGVILSAGRVFGEAAALIYTAGQSAPPLDFLNFNLLSYTCPWNIFRPAETLAVHIWKVNSEGIIPDLDIVSNGTAAVLMLCILIFNIVARALGKRLQKKMSGK